MNYQDAVIAELTKYAERNGCEVLTEYKFSNVGRLLIGSVTDLKVVVDFNFQSGGTNKLTLTKQGANAPASNSYAFSSTNPERVKAAITRLRELLGDKLIEEKDR